MENFLKIITRVHPCIGDIRLFKNNDPTLQRFVSHCVSYMGRGMAIFYASIKHEFYPNSFLFALLCLPDASNNKI